MSIWGGKAFRVALLTALSWMWQLFNDILFMHRKPVGKGAFAGGYWLGALKRGALLGHSAF